MPPGKDFNSKYRFAMDKAIELLARRAHTRWELSAKLKQRGYHSEIISKVLSECQRLNYIDDMATANLFISERKRKHYGPHHIRQAMQKKGFSNNHIEKALNDGYSLEEEVKYAKLAVQKKTARTGLKSFSVRKLYFHLYYRGFSTQVIQQILSENSLTDFHLPDN